MICPCDTGKPYQACCKPLHEGTLAASPLALMRSRFSAFALNLIPYLNSTQTVEPIDTLDSSRWTRLLIHGAGDNWVRFSARWEASGQFGTLSEHSLFEQRNDQWLYTQGEQLEMPELSLPTRNANCWCASGKKFKRCHG
ncbi:YchJ family metal-binding protein [uncultured Umboniibacter sp.]|uniref:YchJ family protein n=1 Tax=uncultured Umboniibacter sp. TaxID=1798917 RepID=UPI00262A4236|nr:YchJ family metal-binding protein [uncultured Umboniibacter sp.]